MMTRCYNKKSACYAQYGGRGIKVCRRWWRYENFLCDMGRMPTPEHSLDRIDNTKGYNPKNCRWATRSEQSLNRRDRRLYEGKPLIVWSRETGLDVRLIWERLTRGWKRPRLFAPPQRQLAACHRGHPFRAGNVRWEGKRRRCLTCKREYDRRRRVA